MRFLLATVLIAILSALIAPLLNWWSVAVIAFVVAFMMKLRPGTAFLAGFIGVALCWTGWALWRSSPNEYLLAGKLGHLFSLPGAGAFIAVSAVVGGLTGGMAAWSGSLLLVRKKR